MANLSLYPVSDISQAADAAGFSVFELSTVAWTDNNLIGLMDRFYSGELTEPLVDPSQKISEEDADFFSNFARLTSEDVSGIVERAGEIGKGILPTVSLGLIAIIGIAAVLILRKVG